MKKNLFSLFTFLSLILVSFVNIFILKGIYSSHLPWVWVFSILIPFVPLLLTFNKSVCSDKVIWFKKIILILVILLPLLVRILNYSPFRIHGDDMLTAYFSLHLKLSSLNFFSGYPGGAQWVARFPVIFFLIQKPLLQMLGANVTATKLSVIPYILIVSLMIFLTAKKLMNQKTALIAVFLYAFLAISIYHETLGLHFISSTAIYMIFLYTLSVSYKKTSKVLWTLIGMLCGLCFMFYSSSYFAIIILLIVIIFGLIRRVKKILPLILYCLIGLYVFISPFAVYALKNDNYFTDRVDQVSLLSGEWSSAPEKMKKGTPFYKIIMNNADLSIKSIYKNGIGGHGGYTFGNLAMLNTITIGLLALGLIFGLAVFYKNLLFWLIVITISFSFVFGMVLTIPPPAFHRLSLAFPYLAIVSSIPFYLFFSKKIRFPNLYKYLLVSCVLIVYAYSNQKLFIISIQKEKLPESTKVANYINANYPDRHIHVASFPAYDFEKRYFFLDNKKSLSIDTNYHTYYLDNFKYNEPYVYVIIFPEEFDDKFRAIDKRGKLIKLSQQFSLFVN